MADSESAHRVPVKNIMSVADPGFPVGGGGVWTPEAATFCQICMSKRKNWVP